MICRHQSQNHFPAPLQPLEYHPHHQACVHLEAPQASAHGQARQASAHGQAPQASAHGQAPQAWVHGQAPQAWVHGLAPEAVMGVPGQVLQREQGAKIQTVWLPHVLGAASSCHTLSLVNPDVQDHVHPNSAAGFLQ